MVNLWFPDDVNRNSMPSKDQIPFVTLTVQARACAVPHIAAIRRSAASVRFRTMPANVSVEAVTARTISTISCCVRQVARRRFAVTLRPRP